MQLISIFVQLIKYSSQEVISNVQMKQRLTENLIYYEIDKQNKSEPKKKMFSIGRQLEITK